MTTHELPGPTGWHLVGAFASLLQGDLLKPFVRLFERYGPMFRIPLPLGQDLVMLAHPDAVEQVLQSRQENYRKGSVYDGARLLLGNGLVTSEGDYWRRQRSLANPAFRPAKLEQYLETMGACTRALTASWTPLAGSAPIDARVDDAAHPGNRREHPLRPGSQRAVGAGEPQLRCGARRHRTPGPR